MSKNEGNSPHSRGDNSPHGNRPLLLGARRTATKRVLTFADMTKATVNGRRVVLVDGRVYPTGDAVVSYDRGRVTVTTYP